MHFVPEGSPYPFLKSTVKIFKIWINDNQQFKSLWSKAMFSVKTMYSIHNYCHIGHYLLIIFGNLFFHFCTQLK